MQSPDVNVLVSAFRTDATHHERCRGWLDGAVAGREALAIEHGCEWVTLDHGFSMYPGLRCRNLLGG